MPSLVQTLISRNGGAGFHNAMATDGRPPESRVGRSSAQLQRDRITDIVVDRPHLAGGQNGHQAGPTIAGNSRARSIGAMVFDAVRAQERALEMSQGWSENVVATLKEQAASDSALLHSVDASLRAMEQAVKSQAEATKALTENLEASRKVVSTAMTTQQHTVERVETFVGGVLDALSGQLQTMRTQMEAGQGVLADPGAAPSKVLLQMTQDWMDAYGQLRGHVHAVSTREQELSVRRLARCAATRADLAA